MQKLKFYGLILVCLMVTGLLVACGEATSVGNGVPALPTVTPLPNVSPGITPIIPPLTTPVPTGQPSPQPTADTGTGGQTHPTPTAANPSTVVIMSCGPQTPLEIEGPIQLITTGTITINGQTYRYSLSTANGQPFQVGSPVHLSLRCNNTQLEVVKIILITSVNNNNGDNADEQGNKDKGNEKDKGKGNGKKPNK